jgi:Lrp/AsnC family transcriptional regulator for asnA, asnC and gidA
MPEADNNRRVLTLDALDRKILECLREDGRMNVSEIARRVETSQNTVKRRLARMEGEGGMKVVPVLDPDAVGLDDCIYVGIKVEAGKIQEVSDRIKAMPEVRYLAHTTGPWDLLVEAFVGSRRHMADFLLRSVGEQPGIISTETWSVLKIAKFGYEWEVPEYYEEAEHESPLPETSNAHPGQAA